MDTESPCLLITDDDRALRDTLVGAFEPRGFQTLVAGDGQEAVEIVCQQTVHIVLLDMHMPRLSGLEAARQVQQLRPLPCILMSAGMDDDLRNQAEAAQLFGILSKPFSFAELATHIREALASAYGWDVPL